MVLLVHGNYNNVLSEKILVCHKLAIKDTESHILCPNYGFAEEIVFHNGRGRGRHGNYTNDFSENLVHRNLVILEQKWFGILLTLNLLSSFFINFTQ